MVGGWISMVVPAALLAEQRMDIHTKPGFTNYAVYTQGIYFFQLSCYSNRSTIQVGLRNARIVLGKYESFMLFEIPSVTEVHECSAWKRLAAK